MSRILISQTPEHIGEKVSLAGWVHVRRDHGKLVFIDLRDRSGIIQTVIIPDGVKAYEIAKDIRSGAVVRMEGIVKERPASACNNETPIGCVELEVSDIFVLSRSEGDLPIDISQEKMDLQLETLLNNRMLAIRNPRVAAIFRIYAELLHAYADIMRADGFLEIKTPKIVEAATEGGANVFKIKYFERDAFLAQSPQFYKQAGAGAFERVFEIGPVFRAEPHYTTRHVNEYISLDAEMAFIEGIEDLMKQMEKILSFVMASIEQLCIGELAAYGATVPKIGVIPRMKLTEALDILDKQYGKKMEEVDIDPEGERLICEWVKKTYDSDFVFLTHYPRSIRPFYAMPGPDPQYTESFDLLFRGVEIATGGQRIHDYKQLIANIKSFGLEPEAFSGYLEMFRNGMPPHGGWGMGSERIVQRLLELGSIKETVLFPRDVKRLSP